MTNPTNAAGGPDRGPRTQGFPAQAPPSPAAPPGFAQRQDLSFAPPARPPRRRRGPLVMLGVLAAVIVLAIGFVVAYLIYRPSGGSAASPLAAQDGTAAGAAG